MFQPQKEDTFLEHSKSIYSEIFEDADTFLNSETHVKCLNELENQTDTENGALSGEPQTKGPETERPLSDGPLSNMIDTTEDWDKEIQDSLAYNVVLETFKERSHNKVCFQNQLQNLLYSYPPASQAFTKTANYESAVYSSPVPPPSNKQLLYGADTGQFDDADEDSCIES